MWVCRKGLYDSAHRTFCNTFQGPYLPPYASFHCSQQRSSTPGRSVFSLFFRQMITQSTWSCCFPHHGVSPRPTFHPSASLSPIHLSRNSYFFPMKTSWIIPVYIHLSIPQNPTVPRTISLLYNTALCHIHWFIHISWVPAIFKSFS